MEDIYIASIQVFVPSHKDLPPYMLLLGEPTDKLSSNYKVVTSHE